MDPAQIVLESELVVDGGQLPADLTAPVSAAATMAHRSHGSSSWRRLHESTIQMRWVVVREAATVLFLDIPALVAAAIAVGSVYRSYSVIVDLLGPFRSNSKIAAMRKVAFTHFALIVLDLLTIFALLLLVATVYRLPKTLRKIQGAENVWNRKGRHWARPTLSANIDAGDLSGKATPRRANWYILKRAAKVICDALLAILFLASMIIPSKTVQVMADLQLLFWFQTPREHQIEAKRSGPARRSNEPSGCAANALQPVPVTQLAAPWVCAIVIATIYWFCAFGIWTAGEPASAGTVTGSSSGSGSYAFESPVAVAAAVGLEGEDEVELDITWAWLGGGFLFTLCCLVSCCVCCDFRLTHYLDIGVDGADRRGLSAGDWRRDGASKRQRYTAAANIAWYHLSTVPLDCTLEVMSLLATAVIFCSHWRWAELKRASGPSLSIKGWEELRWERYSAVSFVFVQWLFDIPAVCMLVVLMVRSRHPLPHLPSGHSKRDMLSHLWVPVCR